MRKRKKKERKMKIFTLSNNYTETIEIAKNLSSDITLFNKNIIYHCYWYGELTKKHLYSIKSCYYWNIHKKHERNNKIILWTNTHFDTSSPIYHEIIKYAEIKEFDLINEIKSCKVFDHKQVFFSKNFPYFTDLVRVILLFKYSGIWFDLDMFFLRDLHPLIEVFGNEICVYRWENEFYPNNAFFMSVVPFDRRMEYFINFMLERKKGWGFQESNLTLDLVIPLLVLPCSWFDPNWIPNDYHVEWDDFFKTTERVVSFKTFFNGSFCYHWHNRWNDNIEENSYFDKLCKTIDDLLNIQE